MHELHEAIHLAAALVLVNGGAVILLLAAIERRRRLAAGGDVVGHGRTSGTPSARAVEPVPTAVRFEVAVAVTLSVFAAAIHLAAGPDHVVELGDLGLLFYAAAMFQAVWAVAFVRRPDRAAIGSIGVVGNLAISGAWLLSRTIGLPTGPDPWVPEAIGVPDSVATVFQLALVAILLLQLRSGGDRRGRRVPHRAARPRRSWSAAVGVPVIGVAFLVGVLATSVAAAGHDDHGSPDHASTVATGHAHAP